MNIITWNCNMAFRKKASIILQHHPDILVIQECECPENLIFDANTPKPTDTLWFGKNKHKGLAIFSYGNFRIKALDCHNTALQIIVPISVTGGSTDFNLFAIWANNPDDPDGQYVEQVWKAILHYDALLLDTPTILTGDFNSNTIWDKEHRAGNHSEVVKLLDGKGIRSAYHLHNGQIQGQELHPTFYLYRHQNKPYHIDYCFVSDDLAALVSAVEVGAYSFWAKYSDHVPLMVEFDRDL